MTSKMFYSPDDEVCYTCESCIEKSNKHKGAELHTIHFMCTHMEHNVNPDDTCKSWKQRKGKMILRYKDGFEEELEKLVFIE